MLTDIYHVNLAALQKRYPAFAQSIDAIPDDPRITICTQEDRLVSAAYTTDPGKEILLHSKYDPVREAHKLVDGYALSPTVNVVVLGFGLGYHILDLVGRKSNRNFFIICESNPAMIKIAMQHVNLTVLFQRSNILWFIGEQPERLNALLKNRALSVLANGVTVVLHPPSVQLNTAFYEKIRKTLEDFSVYARVNVNTQIEKAEEFSRNAFANFEEYVRARPVSDLFGIAEGVPVFIVGAGPSLDKTVGYLKEIRGRGFIISVDSAVATLLSHGIRPDFVVSIDFTKHTLEYFKNIDTRELSLIFDLEICPEVLQLFQGNKYAIHLPNKSISEWITSIIGNKGAIHKGLSVSHSAALLATKMGAAQIILVGQDLAYPRSQWHAKGSHFFQNLEITNEKNLSLCETEDIFGHKTKSSTALMVFKNHFEMLIESVQVPVYDATEGGAKIRGAQVISLKDAIIRFCAQIEYEYKENGDNFSTYYPDIEKVYETAKQMCVALKTFNANAVQASLKIKNTLDAFNRDKNRVLLRNAIYDTQTVISMLDKDQGLLDLLKDNATEALLIRERKGFDNIFDMNTLADDEILFKLRKEQMFFTVLARASEFVAGQLQGYLEKHSVGVNM